LGDGVKAAFKGTDLVTLPGMSRPIRPINPDFLPNQAVVDAINSPQIQAWTKDADFLIAPRSLGGCCWPREARGR